MNEAGIHKSAVLLRALGEATASEVLKYLDANEATQLRSALAALGRIDQRETQQVLDEFESRQPASLEAAEDSASVDIDPDATDSSDTASAVARLAGLSAPSAAQALADEPAQAVTAILRQLEQAHADAIITHLPQPLRDEVMARDGTFTALQPDALDEIEAALAEILANRVPLANPSRVESIDRGAAALIDRLRDEPAGEPPGALQSFAQIGQLNQDDLRRLLQAVPQRSLVIALKGADEALLGKVVAAMDERAAQQLCDALAAKGPLRLSEIEREQREIVRLAEHICHPGVTLDYDR